MKKVYAEIGVGNGTFFSTEFERKKVIIIKAGHILTKLKKSADMVINAQCIKKHIIHIKTKT